MTHEEEVRRAIAWLNGFDTAFSLTQDHVDAVNTLLSLAKNYLNKSLEPKVCDCGKPLPKYCENCKRLWES